MLRIEASDIVCLLIGKPQNAFVVEYGRMGIDPRATVWSILRDLAGLGIKFADVTGRDRGKPDVAILVGDQSVRAGVGRLQWNSLNTPVFGSSRPSLLAPCPVYQSEPSGASAGSCGRDLAVGTSYSFICHVKNCHGSGTGEGSGENKPTEFA